MEGCFGARILDLGPHLVDAVLRCVTDIKLLHGSLPAAVAWLGGDHNGNSSCAEAAATWCWNASSIAAGIGARSTRRRAIHLLVALLTGLSTS
ncbi:hypothetical protein E2562_023050 [Oryza meyeriana var. granulata]|uniref:Uncharacterized protein n=1 Tax=Oryza meyeriana var. granulata TaxID=110450 RepID=A0A6G1EYQ6_9ORYZ|nr:hypothetical protein E2562_023050 [Oryza meyeriana var. granulata]